MVEDYLLMIMVTMGSNFTTGAGVNFYIRNAAVGATPEIKCVKDGTVELYHNGSKKIETYSGGVQITGTCT